MLKSLFIMGKFVALCWTCRYTAAKKKAFPNYFLTQSDFFSFSIYPRARWLRIYWDKLQLLKTMMFLGFFGFCKKCRKFWYLKLTKKHFIVLLVFNDYLFFLEICTTYLTSQCPIFVFHMVNHGYQVNYAIFVEEVSRWKSTSKNIY